MSVYVPCLVRKGASPGGRDWARARSGRTTAANHPNDYIMGSVFFENCDLGILRRWCFPLVCYAAEMIVLAMCRCVR